MPDREKVIYDIGRCICHVPYACKECSRYGKISCIEELLADALELLKEQEAVEPKQVDLYGKDDWYGIVCVCPDCKAEWMSSKDDTHFCPKCGQAVKWE